MLQYLKVPCCRVPRQPQESQLLDDKAVEKALWSLCHNLVCHICRLSQPVANPERAEAKKSLFVCIYNGNTEHTMLCWLPNFLLLMEQQRSTCCDALRNDFVLKCGETESDVFLKWQHSREKRGSEVWNRPLLFLEWAMFADFFFVLWPL